MMWRLTYGISDIIQILSSNILQEYKYIEKYDEVVGDTDVREVQKERTVRRRQMLFARRKTSQY